MVRKNPCDKNIMDQRKARTTDKRKLFASPDKSSSPPLHRSAVRKHDCEISENGGNDVITTRVVINIAWIDRRHTSVGRKRGEKTKSLLCDWEALVRLRLCRNAQRWRNAPRVPPGAFFFLVFFFFCTIRAYCGNDATTSYNVTARSDGRDNGRGK